MRVLATCVPGYGHLHPMVPLALALGGAGHQVAFATEERFCRRVEQVGLPAIPAGMGPGKVFERTLALPDVAPPGPDHAARFGAQMFAAVAAPAKVPDLVEAVGRWRPDLVVTDVTDFAGPVAAAVAGVPCVAHGLGPLFPMELFEAAEELVAPTWRAWRQEPRPLGGMFDAAYLDTCPPSLRPGDAGRVSTVTRPLRPVPFDALPSESLPPWADDLGARPVVYVTLGTVENEAPGVLEAAVEGLRDEPVDLVVTVGPSRDPDELGPQPPHVHVERYVAQSLLLPRCEVVVAHGGSGTMLAALALGLPLLLLPQGANQFANAERCAALGVAVCLGPAEVGPDAVRRAVRRLREDPSYRSGAGAVAAEIAAMPPPDDVVPDLVALASAGRPPS
ncbi:MAG TPA: glycosyltransferase [Acidimicrobiales bacterium]|nr:glycosyltransferase [Acidimicrobiales bacterium]